MNLVPCQTHSKSEPYHLIDPQRAGLSWERVVKYRRFIFLWRQTYFFQPAACQDHTESSDSKTVKHTQPAVSLSICTAPHTSPVCPPI